MSTPKREIGSASVLIDLTDGQITVSHGEDGTVLGKTRNTTPGDWESLIDFLKSDLGIIWEYQI